MYYTIIPQSNELYHYGVIGMHWGVRRYQNYDGTRIGKGSGPVTGGKAIRSKDRPTGTHYTAKLSRSVAAGQGGNAKGNARLAATANPKKGLADKLTDKSIKQGKGKENISPAEKLAKETKSGAESGKQLTQQLEKMDKNVQKKQEAAEQSSRQKAKQMSDKELRDTINRIRMEREYVSLTTPEVQTGYDKARDILEVVGDVAGITLAILGIVTTIKSLKHDGLDTDEQDDVLDILLHSVDFDEEFVQHAIDLDEEYIEDYLEQHGILDQK